MWLKRLELWGFKSFYEKTVLEFTPGISAIVGPNGCGKSNIVDAVRWAMGEQGLRTLRAKNSEDLIFAGSGEFPPSQTAEVSLIFDNQDGTAPGQFRNLTEIEITRRLHRSGESEYLINRAPCRLKDIVEFFLGTGLGKQAYSIIEQGEIERIIQAKPGEIRGLIEESAGISKYRFRRDEALRKIELTEQNLARVRDILLELKRQLNSLSRQAKKAERYHRYRSELRDKELVLFAYRAGEVKKALSLLEQEKEQAEREKEQLSSRKLLLESELEKAGSSVFLLEQELQKAYEAKLETKSRIKQLESELELLSRQKENEQQAEARRLEELAELNSIQAQLSQEFKNKEEEKDQVEFELASLLADLEAGEKELAQRQKEYQEEKHRTDRLRGELEQIQNQLVRAEERREGLFSRKKELEKQLRELDARISQDTPRLQDYRQRSFNFNQSLYELKKAFSELEARISRVQQEREKLNQSFSEQKGRVEELRARYQEVLARHQSLAEMVEKLEGFERGVKFVLERARSQPEENGIYGLLADIIETSPEYEQAVEAVLGERIQSILVESPERACQAIEWLREESAGWGAFVPKKLKAGEPVAIPEQFQKMGAKPLLEVIQVREGFEEVAQALLGPALLVDDLDKALQLWRQNNFRGAFVTPEGVVLDPVGILSGGKRDQSGILSKKRQLKELEKEKESLRARLQDAEKGLSETQSRLLLKEKELEELLNRKHRLELEVLNQEKDLKRANDELNLFSEELEGLKEEKARLNQELVELEKELEVYQEKLREDERKVEKLKEELEQAEKSVQEKESELNQIQIRLNHLSQERARFREKLLALEESRLRIKERIDESKKRSGLLEQELEEGKSRLEEFDSRLEELRAEISMLNQSLEQENERELNLESERNQRAEELEGLRRQAKELAGRLEELGERVKSLELKIEKKRLELENQANFLGELYDLNLDEVLREFEPRTRQADFNPEEYSLRVEELKRLLHRMGEVNPTALEEYQEIESRYNFLSEQESDLISALEKLKETIQKINREYRRQFKATFEAVNQHFQELFPRLFGGGKAMLVLDEGSDLLDAGIEIIAQPPGKKLQSLSLLSGGEKSLCALALIFALFLHRPSPFCLLDEADASLDDVNIDRFNHLLRKMSENSQILLVTHNKRTMELADVIYGVTMEKPGISKVVSVRLEQVPE